MEALIIGLLIIILMVYAFIKHQHKKKELASYEHEKQTKEIAKGIEELINELVQESEYGKQTNKEVEQLKSEVKQLRKELSELKRDDHNK